MFYRATEPIPALKDLLIHEDDMRPAHVFKTVEQLHMNDSVHDLPQRPPSGYPSDLQKWYRDFKDYLKEHFAAFYAWGKT
eukprot:7048473-Pyramimonas_sp.AAC.1